MTEKQQHQDVKTVEPEATDFSIEDIIIDGFFTTPKNNYSDLLR